MIGFIVILIPSLECLPHTRVYNDNKRLHRRRLKHKIMMMYVLFLTLSSINNLYRNKTNVNEQKNGNNLSFFLVN
jgi:hypothetical protein